MSRSQKYNPSAASIPVASGVRRQRGGVPFERGAGPGDGPGVRAGDQAVVDRHGVVAAAPVEAQPVTAAVGGRQYVKLPDERIGEMFVFRVFDRISYALIMNVIKPVKVGDRFTQPDNTQYASVEPRPAAYALTIRDVADAEAPARPGVVRLWAEMTWSAWSDHHEQVRAWLAAPTHPGSGWPR